MSSIELSPDYRFEPPADSIQLSSRLAWFKEDGKIVFFDHSGPILLALEDDRESRRLCGAMLSLLGLAGPAALGEALSLDRVTIYRHKKRFEERGIQGILSEGWGGHSRGHRSIRPHLGEAQALLDKGVSRRRVAEEIGVSDFTVREAIKEGLLKAPAKRSARKSLTPASAGPGERAVVDQSCSDAGVAVKRHEERSLAPLGLLTEAEIRFEAADSVSGAGVLLALPLLLQEGLIEVGEQAYGSLKDGFYGLRTMLLLLALMALLRIKTPEQINEVAPGELGRLLGLDRSPEVKTIRRKVRELAERRKAQEFAAELARKWAKQDPHLTGILYIDGHVRPYNGRKHKLPKTFVQRRRMCMPAETEYWVNDRIANPYLCIPAPFNTGLVEMLDAEILPEIRELVGADRRVTIVFDREGWTPGGFERWYEQGFDVLTYRKYKYEDWPEEDFEEVEREIEGKKVRYQLAQQAVRMRAPDAKDPKDQGFWVLEIRRLCESGKQVAIVTTVEERDAFELAHMMFSRWTQENFFRYLRHEFALDHVMTQEMEPSDPDHLVVNPERKKQEKENKKLQAELARYEQEVGIRKLEGIGGKPSRKKKRIKSSDEEILRQVRRLRRQMAEVDAAAKALPEYVTAARVRPGAMLVKQDSERKTLSNCIKMVAYRAETWIYRYLNCFLDGWDVDDRSFVQTALSQPGDLIPDEDAGTLTVRLHPMPHWRSTRALRFLCESMTRMETTYPGTSLRLVFEVREVAS